MPTSAELIAAVKAGDIDKVKLRMGENRSLASARDENGVSVLMLALYTRRQEIANLLGNRDDLDIFEAASLGRPGRVSEILNADSNAARSWSGDGFTPLHLAAFFNRPDVARTLIRQGADISAVAKNPMKVTPLHSAAAAHSTEIVRLLVENGAPPNMPQEGGWVPLHAAAQDGDIEMVRALLEYGADPLIRSSSGKTPVDMARERGHSEVVERLSR